MITHTESAIERLTTIKNQALIIFTYDQQINKSKAGKTVVAFFIIAGIITVVVSGVATFYNLEKSEKTYVILPL